MVIRGGWQRQVLLMLAVGLSIVVPADAGDDAAMAQTLLRGLSHREESIVSMHGTVTHGWFLSDAERQDRTPLPPMSGTAVSAMPTVRPERSLTLLEFSCVADRLRLDAAALMPGRNVGAVAYRLQGLAVVGSSQEIAVSGPSGPTYVPSDHIRSTVLRDGGKRFFYSSQRRAVIVEPQEWSGPVASAPVVNELMLLGPGSGRTFASTVSNFLEVAEVVNSHVVSVQQVNRGGRMEYQLAISITSAEMNIADYLIYFAPQWGYAVTAFESKSLTPPNADFDQWGAGYVYCGEDFREVSPGIWMPFRIVRERYEYGHDAPPWRETWETVVLDLEVNGAMEDSVFSFIVPPGVLVVDGMDPMTHQHSAFLQGRATQAARTFGSRTVPTADRVLNVGQ